MIRVRWSAPLINENENESVNPSTSDDEDTGAQAEFAQPQYTLEMEPPSDTVPRSRIKEAAPADQTSGLSVPVVIAGRYAVRSEIGRGPTGVVYRGFDREIEIDIAIKLIPRSLLGKGRRSAAGLTGPGLGDDGYEAAPPSPSVAEQRTLAALRRMQSVVHPHIARCFDMGIEGSHLFVVSQICEGLTLRKLMELRKSKREVFGPQEVVAFAEQIAKGLTALHRAGMTAGLLRPENILLLPTGLKMTDLGLWWALPESVRRELCLRHGFESYLAPEVRPGEPASLALAQAASRPFAGSASPSADTYALARLAEELFGGPGQVPKALLPVLADALAPGPAPSPEGDGSSNWGAESRATPSELVEDLVSVLQTGRRRKRPGPLPQVAASDRKRRGPGASPGRASAQLHARTAPKLGRTPGRASNERSDERASEGSTTARRPAPEPTAELDENDLLDVELGHIDLGSGGSLLGGGARATGTSENDALGKALPGIDQLSHADDVDYGDGAETVRMESERTVRMRMDQLASMLMRASAKNEDVVPVSRPPAIPQPITLRGFEPARTAEPDTDAEAVEPSLFEPSGLYRDDHGQSEQPSPHTQRVDIDDVLGETTAPDEEGQGLGLSDHDSGFGEDSIEDADVPEGISVPMGVRTPATLPPNAEAAARSTGPIDAPAQVILLSSENASAFVGSSKPEATPKSGAGEAASKSAPSSPIPERIEPPASLSGTAQAITMGLPAIKAPDEPKVIFDAASLARTAPIGAKTPPPVGVVGAHTPGVLGVEIPGDGPPIAATPYDTARVAPYEAPRKGGERPPWMNTARGRRGRVTTPAFVAAMVIVALVSSTVATLIYLARKEGSRPSVVISAGAAHAESRVAERNAAAAHGRCPEGTLPSSLSSEKGGRDHSFCIDAFEFPGEHEVPRTGVAFSEAKQACEGRGGRLCKRAEWIASCQSGPGSDFPYGPLLDAKKCNVTGQLAEAGRHAECESAVGAYDMLGNVAEWVEEQVAIGGSATTERGGARCSSERKVRPQVGAADIGFRCCFDPGT